MKNFIFVALAILANSSLSAQETNSSVDKDNKGKHKIGIYGWLPKVDADATVDGGTAPIDLSAKDVLDNLDGAFSARYEYLNQENIGFYSDFQCSFLRTSVPNRGSKGACFFKIIIVS